MAEAILTDTVIEDERWESAGLPALAERAAQATLAHLGLSMAEIVVMGCDDTRIAVLNADFRGKPQPTNVLSWPAHEHMQHAPGAVPELPALTEDDPELGDIAIAWETCQAEAQAQGKPFDHHVTHLLVHGILHLAGYDHVNDADATMMEMTERSVLAALDIPDPYAENQAL